MGLKHFLKNNEKVHYLGICLKMIKNDAFRKKFFALYDTPDVLCFHHMGEKNKEKNIYLIYDNNPTRGFFSLFNVVLDGLYFAQYYNLTPVVEYGPKTVYTEKEKIHGTKNSFEYYFQQTSSVSVEEARKSENVVFYEYNHRKLSIPDFNVTVGASLTDQDKLEKYLEQRAQLIKKYIRFNETVEKYLDETVNTMIGKSKVLGVHVRGTDMRVGYNGHAKAISPEEYLKEAVQAVNVHGYEKIFLATDEKCVLELFSDTFGDKLVYFKDVFRSEDGQAPHFTENNRKNHKYLLGLEVLRDMYTLSMCQGLIAGISNVSLASRMMKKSYDKEYEYINILNHGINDTKITMK